MTINIRFNKITATTISGGGIFIGQNIALGWDSFTKSNTGIANGNYSPITNTIVIVDDRDVFDATVIDADRPIANVAGDPPDGNPISEKRPMIKKESEGGNNQLFVQQDGKQVYPKPKDDPEASDSDDGNEKEPDGKKEDDPKKHEDLDAPTPAQIRRVRSQYLSDS